MHLRVSLYLHPWWRHHMETFFTLLALCAGNSPVTGELPSQRPMTRSFDIFFDLCLNKRLSKQSWGWWFTKPSRPLWRHCNVGKCLDISRHQGPCIRTRLAFQGFCLFLSSFVLRFGFFHAAFVEIVAQNEKFQEEICVQNICRSMETRFASVHFCVWLTDFLQNEPVIQSC